MLHARRSFQRIRRFSEPSHKMRRICVSAQYDMTDTLRIVHVASGDLWAGAEIQAFTLMSRLARMPKTNVSAVLLNEGVLANGLRGAGVEVEVLQERVLPAWRILLELRRFLQAWRPDVVHTHRTKENILGSVANLLGPHVPSVRTTHGASERREMRGWRGAMSRKAVQLDRWCGEVLQARVVAVSEALGRDLSKTFSAKKVVIIENGIDASALRSIAGIADFKVAEPNATHIGFVGRLVEVKRVDLFIKMAALLKADEMGRRWRFHIFGDGPLRTQLEELAYELGLRGDISFHGHRLDAATCINGLDVLVNCSDHEGLPMTALESAALGVPLVAHAVGGLVDVVPAEFLVVRHDPVGYRNAVHEAMQQNAREVVSRFAAVMLQRFSADRNAARTREMYEVLVTSNRYGNAER